MAPFLHYKANEKAIDDSQVENDRTYHELSLRKRKSFSYWQKYRHFMCSPQTILNYEDVR